MWGDTTSVQFRLHNRLDSREQLFTYTVDAPAPVARIPTPEPTAAWMVSTDYRGRSVADWTALDSVVPPGSDSPDLLYLAVGLPAIVANWTRGYYPPPRLTAADTNPLVRPADPLEENSIKGWTVGIGPFPADRRPADLLARLRMWADSSCHIGWIRNRRICHEFGEKLREAARDLVRGHASEAAEDLREFVRELGERFGRGEGEQAHEERAARDRVREPISDAAYWLLKVNAEYILARL
ncbi:MAG TPA: hypothetical protein VMT21_13025 [Gemmatimonadales bacterium]|nr:hypothetical protein [Gemmatimonadales bacterium]